MSIIYNFFIVCIQKVKQICIELFINAEHEIY